MKCAKTPKKSTRNKTHRPKETHNLSGNIDPITSRTQSKIEVFDNLDMAKKNVQKTYLATFLVCWLCKFVLPKEGVNLIHPEVFKVASRMAQGETFNLTIPMLASIYNCLNEIVCSSKLGTNASIFPIHYLHGWLGEYFDTHFLSPSWNHYPQMTYYVGKFSTKFFEDLQVWALITSCKYVKLNHLELRDKELVYWTDKEFITTTQASYLISLRFSYLSL